MWHLYKIGFYSAIKKKKLTKFKFIKKNKTNGWNWKN